MLPQISPVLRVEIGVTTQLTFKLKVAGPKVTITVADAPRMVEMNPSSVSALLDERALLVDGGDDNNGFFAPASGRYRAPYQFSNEVVEEFRVSSSGYGAESGARW
jgi:hypothetical protein